MAAPLRHPIGIVCLMAAFALTVSATTTAENAFSGTSSMPKIETTATAATSAETTATAATATATATAAETAAETTAGATATEAAKTTTTPTTTTTTYMTSLPEIPGPTNDTETNSTEIPNDSIWSSEEFATMEECQCPVNDTATPSFVSCVCTNRSGIIRNPDSSIGSANYIIDIGEPATVIVYFTREDVAVSSYCQITVGDTAFTEAGDLKDVNQVTTTDAEIRVNGVIPMLCKYQFHYFAYPPQDPTVIILTGLEDTIMPPADELGYFDYRPFTQTMWVLQPDVPVSDFNFTFSHVDLGSPSPYIHLNHVEWTSADFLLVGTSERLLDGSDQMFYGRYEDLKNVVTFGHQSHVFFSSSSSLFNATGFNISYAATAIDPVTTPTPTTTVNPPAPWELKTTYVASINMAPMNTSYINHTITTFKESMANMSTEYARLKGITTKDEIMPSTVEVFNVTTCNSFLCNAICVAFNFSIAALSLDEMWIFTAPVLKDMLFTPQLQYAVKHIGDQCQVCNEDTDLNLYLYISIPVGIVVFGIIVSSVLYYMGGRSNMVESRRKYEQEIADRRDDNRRRSSADVSILGLGGSMASRGSLSSRRFTMPFPKSKKEDDIQEENGGSIDMSGFKEFDPDLGRIDPAEFGMASEFLNNRSAMAHYGNPGFVNDEEEDERSVFRRVPPTANAAGTDSDDSDGGAVSFSASMRMKKVPPTMQASVDVHRIEESGESAL